MYTLEHAGEPDRLEIQSNGRQYSLARELAHVPLPFSGTILDVGCGSGVLCRYIKRHHPLLRPHGVDSSRLHVEFARSLDPDIEYESLDILESEPAVLGRRFDVIVNRYVAHHLGERGFVRALRWMRSHLEPEGMVVIVDIDGAIVNLATSNAALRRQIRRVEETFPGDLRLARRVPHLLRSHGFSRVDYRFEAMDIQGADLDFECRLYERRFTSCRAMLAAALGADAVDDFTRGFIEELRTLGIVYNKVIAAARS